MPNATVTCTPNGVYLITIPGHGGVADVQFLIDTSGRVVDLSGAAVLGSDVVIVQGELRSAGAVDLAELVTAWWHAQR